MPEAIDDWLSPQPPLVFHRTGFDVCYGADTASVRQVPEGDLVCTGEGYGVVLRAGAHIGHAALYAASVSRTGHVPVWLQTYKGILIADSQAQSWGTAIPAERRAVVMQRFDTIDMVDIEQAGRTALDTDDRLAIGAEAMRMCGVFLDAPSARNGASLRGRHIDTKTTL